MMTLEREKQLKSRILANSYRSYAESSEKISMNSFTMSVGSSTTLDSLITFLILLLPTPIPAIWTPDLPASCSATSRSCSIPG